MRKYNVIIVAVVLVCLFASCSDLLEQPKNVVTEVNFYSSKGEAEAGLTGAMAQASAAANVNLRDNEGFVDLFAGLLHQALTTMEYDGIKGVDVITPNSV